MSPASHAPHSPATELSDCSKSELLSRLAHLPCAPRTIHEDCPGERLILELSTHRIELDAQNQELRESQQYIEDARDRYSDLYDFAPVGYLTLSRQGSMNEINLTGSDMLGCCEPPGGMSWSRGVASIYIVQSETPAAGHDASSILYRKHLPSMRVTIVRRSSGEWAHSLISACGRWNIRTAMPTPITKEKNMFASGFRRISLIII